MTDCQSINIEIPEKPYSGMTWIKPKEYGNGFWQIMKNGDPADRTSWNADNAVALEITQWSINPYDHEGDFFQQCGTASGKIYVCYEGYGDFKNSYAAGTFKDVPVRYMGEPELEY